MNRVWLVVAPLVLLAMHAAALILGPLSPDELAVVDLGRMLRSPCAGWVDVPWDQPPLAYLISAGLTGVADASGLGLQTADRVAALGLRAVAAVLIVLAWGLLHQRLASGPARWTWFVACALSPALLGASSLGMAHSLAAGLGGVLLLGLAREDRTGQVLLGTSLAALVATSWAAWSVVPAVGLLLFRDSGPLRRRLAPLAPAVIIGIGWLALSAFQLDWVLERAGRAGVRGSSLPVLHALHSFVAGRGRSIAGLLLGAGVLIGLGVLGAQQPTDRLARAARALAVGPWLVLVATSPVIWLGHDKFVLFLALPTLLLMAIGAGRAWAFAGATRHAGIALACVALLLLGMGGATFGKRLPGRFIPAVWAARPLAWTCAEPFEPASSKADSATATPPRGTSGPR